MQIKPPMFRATGIPANHAPRFAAIYGNSGIAKSGTPNPNSVLFQPVQNRLVVTGQVPVSALTLRPGLGGLFVSPGATVEGDVVFPENIILKEKSRITGNIQAKNADIRGKVGHISATEVVYVGDGGEAADILGGSEARIDGKAGNITLKNGAVVIKTNGTVQDIQCNNARIEGKANNINTTGTVDIFTTGEVKTVQAEGEVTVRGKAGNITAKSGIEIYERAVVGDIQSDSHVLVKGKAGNITAKGQVTVQQSQIGSDQGTAKDIKADSAVISGPVNNVDVCKSVAIALMGKAGDIKAESAGVSGKAGNIDASKSVTIDAEGEAGKIKAESAKVSGKVGNIDVSKGVTITTKGKSGDIKAMSAKVYGKAGDISVTDKVQTDVDSEIQNVTAGLRATIHGKAQNVVVGSTDNTTKDEATQAYIGWNHPEYPKQNALVENITMKGANATVLVGLMGVITGKIRFEQPGGTVVFENDNAVCAPDDIEGENVQIMSKRDWHYQQKQQQQKK